MLTELLRVQDELGLKVSSLIFYPYRSFQSAETAAAFGSRMCSAGRTACTISEGGEIRPCSHAPMSYGSIFEGLEQAWEKMGPWRSNDLIPDKCQSCHLRFRCGGGCKIEALTVNGSLNSSEPYCQGPEALTKSKKGRRQTIMLDREAYSVDQAIRHRDEEFGGILFSRKRRMVVAEPALYHFVVEKRGSSFRINELSKALGVGDNFAQDTLQLLLDKGIIL